MRKLIIFVLCICAHTIAHAELLKTVTNLTAGELSTTLTTAEKRNVTNLTITGEINALDFATMRSMSSLVTIDISEVSVSGNAIPDSAFYTDVYLGSIKLPLSITAIKYAAFSGCSRLSTITIPPSVTTIEDYAFFDCAVVDSIFIPASVSSIKNDAFWGLCGIFVVDANNPNYSSTDGVLFNKDQSTLLHCPSSKKGTYTVPPTVTTIDYMAFNYCRELTSVFIPASVTSIDTNTTNSIYNGVNAFMDCGGLIDIDANNPVFSSFDGVIFNKDQSQLIQCPNTKLGNYNIPSTVKSVAPFAFLSCKKLTSISIPSSVTSIGKWAFGLCQGITSVVIPSSVSVIESSAFSSCQKLTSVSVYGTTPLDLSASLKTFFGVNKTTCKLYVPLGTKSAYQAANQWQDFVNIEEYYLYISADAVNISADEGSTKSLDITSNTAWVMTSDKDWLTADFASCTGDKTLTLKAQANLSDIPRTATITVSASGVPSKTTLVTQDASGTTSLISETKESITVYPNPAREGLQISGIDGTATFILSDIKGELIIKREIISGEYVTLSNLPNGIYTVKIINSNASMETKLVKN